MKKIYLAVFSLFSIGAFAQIPNFNPNNMSWPTSGNVGMGTASPIEKLEVLQNISTTPQDIAFFGYRTLMPGQFPDPGWNNIQGLYIQNKNNGPKLQAAYTDSRGEHPLINSGYIDFSSGSLLFGNNNSTYMRILSGGKVTIADGTTLTTPDGYRLFVQDGILTEKVKVAIEGTANWADYVFADDYNLMPLAEVEAFTQENHHLPNVPSAEEMVTNGLDVAQMDAKLLEKIEELTLYLIEQNKQIEQQNKKIEALSTELKELKK